MKKSIKIYTIIICIVILTGCNGSNPSDINTTFNSTIPTVTENSKESIEEGSKISPLDLDTEKGVREYLVGEWTCKMEYMSNVVVNLNIYENLDLQLSFYDSSTNEPKEDYKGKIIFKRIYTNEDDAPDMITLQLDDDKYTECDYYFFHRTIYDKKRVMSLFFAGTGNSVFNILTGNDISDYTISEVLLEKVTGEITKGNIRKNDEFYAIFWGYGIHNENIWIDDVEWTERDEDYNPNYPVPMIVHENKEKESTLYNLDQDKKVDILGDDIFKGDVYFVQTNSKGNIVELISADYKKFLEQSSEETENEIKDQIFRVIKGMKDIQEYLDNGMSILLTGETTIINGKECYEVFLGTNHEEIFVREIHYAVNLLTCQVYKYDVLNDIWE